jgi:hypothetical protein
MEEIIYNPTYPVYTYIEPRTRSIGIQTNLKQTKTIIETFQEYSVVLLSNIKNKPKLRRIIKVIGNNKHINDKRLRASGLYDVLKFLKKNEDVEIRRWVKGMIKHWKTKKRI